MTTFLKDACSKGEAELECMDRIYSRNDTLKNLPYDDLDPSQLPQDRSQRDKWRGSKGQGVRIDDALVTKNEKLEELQDRLDTELDKNSPNQTKVIRYQRQIEKLRNLQTPNNLIPKNKLADFEDRNQSLLASVVETVTSVVSSAFDGLLTSIQNGFLSLKQLVTDTIQVGTPENPAGITVYDQTTKQPFCLIVKDGQLQSVPGECAVTNTTDTNTTPATDENTPSTTPAADTTPPTITLNGDPTISIEKGTGWVDPGATVLDPANGDTPENPNLSIYYQVDGQPTGNEGRDLPQTVIDTNQSGSHVITYSAADSAGNTGTAQRTLNITDPAPAPIPEPSPEPEPTPEPVTDPTPTP